MNDNVLSLTEAQVSGKHEIIINALTYCV